MSISADLKFVSAFFRKTYFFEKDEAEKLDSRFRGNDIF